MHDEHNDDLSAAESERLAALPREQAPPPELEERVVAALRSEGMLSGHSSWQRPAAAAAIFLISISAAFFAGTKTSTPAVDPPPEVVTVTSVAPDLSPFALLVYAPTGAGPGPGAESAPVREAAEWANSLADQGLLTVAEKLGSTGERLRMRDGVVAPVADVATPADGLVMGGFFVIHAMDYEEALRLAETCPLLRYGVAIEVWAIEET